MLPTPSEGGLLLKCRLLQVTVLPVHLLESNRQCSWKISLPLKSVFITHFTSAFYNELKLLPG